MTVGAVGGAGGMQPQVPLPSVDQLRNMVKNLSVSQRNMLLAKDPIPRDANGNATGPADAAVQALLNNPQITAAIGDRKLNLQIGEDTENLKMMNKTFDKIMDKLAEMWKSDG